jgi:hypothetical protein
MLAELLYFLAIALFGFTVLGAARLPNDMWLIMAIFPVFIAAILGFVMWLFAWGQYDMPVSIGALIVPVVAVVAMRRWSTRNMFIAICAAVVLGLIVARFAFLAADIG